ncbi:MAG: NADP-specific glutamate dehydrogenase [Gammaproteobacteria bacterium]
MADALTRARRDYVRGIEARNPHEPEFVQAVCELAESVMPLVLDHSEYREARILERMAEPDRVISFRVCWEDDRGAVRVNRAWRVQFNRSLGPYKGGLRFTADVTPSVLKFLGFEQTFKNALTGLPMGGGKGGADFDPHGASDREVMRFCKALMSELYRHIDPHVDVPAGDVGVGSREIGYLFGEYSRLTNRFEGGVLTGKGLTFGGSAVREEATGHGVICMLIHALEHHGRGLEGQRVAISGAGNVALQAAETATAEGARVVTVSDSGGTAWCRDGFDADQIAHLQRGKLVDRGRLEDLAATLDGVEFHAGAKPWCLPCDVALPAAIENDIDDAAAGALLDGGLVALAEGANMPVTASASRRLREAGVVFLPAKAANAGGVAVSGLEQSQNATRVSWSHDEVARRLHAIMRDIHDECVARGGAGPVTDYFRGANVAAFERVARAMLAYGIV